MCLFFFFFFKQKTAYEMRISDWSSDVCSSDLLLLSRTLLRFDHHVEDAFGHAGVRRVQQRRDVEACAHDRAFVRERLEAEFAVRRADGDLLTPPNGRLPCANGMQTWVSPVPPARSAQRRVGVECVQTCESRG